MDTCERHTSAPALSSPSCLFIPEWNASDWHTHSFTGSTLSIVMSNTTIYSYITIQCNVCSNKIKVRKEGRRTFWGSFSMKHTKGARLQILTVFQCCGGYSLAWFWDPVHGSLLWCHCRYIGLGRSWHCPWAERRASPPTSRAAAWPACPACPCMPQNSHL